MSERRSYYNAVLFEPYEAMLAGKKYPYSVLDGWMLYNCLYKIMDLSEEQRAEYRIQAREMTPRKMRERITDQDETKEDHEIRIIKTAKHLAFKDWIQEKAMEGFDLRGFISPMIKD